MVVSRATSPPVNNSNNQLQQQHEITKMQQSQPSSTALQSTTASNQPHPLLFSDNFWGEKLNGFEVLCQNLKHSLTSVKDLETFFRESANGEDTYGKVLNKLSLQIANKFSTNGAFTPMWTPLRELNERYAHAHQQLQHQLQELVKETQRYHDELSKRVKRMRENELQTQQVVQAFQDITQALNKAREQYQNFQAEFEKQKRLLDTQQMAQYLSLVQQQQAMMSTTNLIAIANNNTSVAAIAASSSTNSTSASALPGVSGPIALAAPGVASTAPSFDTTSLASATSAGPLTTLATSITVSKVAQVIKLEKKMKLSLEDYKSCIEKYNTIRVEYERKLADSCNNFQLNEEAHLRQMRSLVDSYTKYIFQAQSTKQLIFNEFQHKFREQYTTDHLLQVFIANKHTGIERPEAYVDQQTMQGGNEAADLFLLRTMSPPLQPPSTTIPSTIDHIDQTQSQQQQQQQQLRGTPPVTFFSASNLLLSNGPSGAYTSLTNSISSTNLTTAPTATVGGNLISLSSTGSSAASPSPISFNSSAVVAVISPNKDAGGDSSSGGGGKKGDGKSSGLNIFNVDFLSRKKTREMKAAKAAAAAAAAASNATTTSGDSTTSTSKSSKFGRSQKQKTKQQQADTATMATLAVPGSNYNRDSSSINSDEASTAPTTNAAASSSISDAVQLPGNGSGSVTARSISSITGSLSFDLLDQLKSSNGSGSSAVGNNENNNVDSEGYSIRPQDDASIRGTVARRRKHLKARGALAEAEAAVIGNTTNSDMNNFYHSSTSTSDSEDDSDDGDSESGGSHGGGGIGLGRPIKLTIKPKEDLPSSESGGTTQGGSGGTDKTKSNNTELLKEIGKNLKNLQLTKAPSLDSDVGLGSSYHSLKKSSVKKRYYGTAALHHQQQQQNSSSAVVSPTTAAAAASSSSDLFLDLNGSTSTITSNTSTSTITASSQPSSQSQPMTRSYSAAAGVTAMSSTSLFDLTTTKSSSALPTPTTSAVPSLSLFDLDLSTFGQQQHQQQQPPPEPKTTSMPAEGSSVAASSSNLLYNIDEDKEVESSFQFNSNRRTSVPSTAVNSVATLSSTSVLPASTSSPALAQQQQLGRFTPACFPGRTTPDFRHTASMFEQQSMTRASLISPLPTMMSTADMILPIAIAFNETIHAYFKMMDQQHSQQPTVSTETKKFKVKCFGCMKISFPYAVLKHLTVGELPQLEFALANLQIANQDLKVNSQLITNTTDTLPNESGNSKLQFKFIMQNLAKELKDQHQQNKMAAFFNFELLKYEFKYAQAQPPPLVLNAHWSSQESDNTIELHLGYIYANSSKPLSQVNFMIVLPATSSTYKIALIKSEPINALVQENDNKLQVLWQVPSINTNGSLNAKFQVTFEQQQPQGENVSSSINLKQFYQPVYAKFHIDNETLSRVKFEILSQNYKLSLLKERIDTGKYFCNSLDHQQQQQQTVNKTNSPHEQQQQEESSKLSDHQDGSTSQPNTQQVKKPPFAGQLSTNIGSTVDILLNY